MSDVWGVLPRGGRVVSHVHYSHAESRGPLALAVTAGISLCAVTSMLVAIAIRGFKTQHQFARSQVGAYFLSLVLSDLLQATGSVMNARWMATEGVNTGPFCTAQAALKQTGNLGTALWSLVIAIHTFSLLFLRVRIRDIVFYCIFIGVWAFIGFMVMLGPLILQKPYLGQFWGISGYWCWITDAYHIEQFTCEYLFMFLTVGVSFILYSLIFFRLRGNIKGYGWDMKFCFIRQPWSESASDDEQMSAVGRQMLWYPVAYAVIILPIAVCRWRVIFGHKVPYSATMTADSIFMLSGFVNAILYSTTRKIVNIPTILPLTRFIRIMTPRRPHDPHGASGSASLDDMQFALASSDTKVTMRSTDGCVVPATRHHPPSPGGRQADSVMVDDLWQRRHGFEFPDYIRAEIAGGKSLPCLEKPPKMHIEPSDSGQVVGTQHTVSPKERHIEQTPWQSLLPSSSHTTRLTRPRASSEPRLNMLPSPLAHNFSEAVEPKFAFATSSTSPSIDVGPSGLVLESPSTTDSAPSLHRKRFSGWSFPSLRDGNGAAAADPGVDDGDSVHTELEEMRFASPSPEGALRRFPSRPVSVNEISLPRWPPRSYPWE